MPVILLELMFIQNIGMPGFVVILAIPIVSDVIVAIACLAISGRSIETRAGVSLLCLVVFWSLLAGLAFLRFG